MVGYTTSVYVTKPTRSTQPCIPSGSLNRVPALNGRGIKSGMSPLRVADPTWHVRSRSGETFWVRTDILRLQDQAMMSQEAWTISASHNLKTNPSSDTNPILTLTQAGLFSYWQQTEVCQACVAAAHLSSSIYAHGDRNSHMLRAP